MHMVWNVKRLIQQQTHSNFYHASNSHEPHGRADGTDGWMEKKLEDVA